MKHANQGLSTDASAFLPQRGSEGRKVFPDFAPHPRPLSLPLCRTSLCTFLLFMEDNRWAPSRVPAEAEAACGLGRPGHIR